MAPKRADYEQLLQAYDSAWWDIADACNVTEVGFDAAPPDKKQAWDRARQNLLNELISGDNAKFELKNMEQEIRERERDRH